MTSTLIESFGLDFLSEDKDLFNAFIRKTLMKAVEIPGYQVIHLNTHYQSVNDHGELLGNSIQIICNAVEDKKGNKELTYFDIHQAGPIVWKCTLIGECLDEKDRYPGQRQIVVKAANGKDGLLVIDVMNSDVLPSYCEDEEITMQMNMIAMEVDFYKDDDDYDLYHKEVKLVPALGTILSSQYLFNHQVPMPEGRQVNYRENDHTLLRGKVKAVYVHDEVFEKKVFLARHLCARVETDYGDIDVVFAPDQLKEDQKGFFFKKGCQIECVGILQGDPAIYEYEHGYIADEAHDLRALRYVMKEGNAERLSKILADDVSFYSVTKSRKIEGKKAVIEFLNSMQEAQREAGGVSWSLSHHYIEGRKKECIYIDYRSSGNQRIFIETDDTGKIVQINAVDAEEMEN